MSWTWLSWLLDFLASSGIFFLDDAHWPFSYYYTIQGWLHKPPFIFPCACVSIEREYGVQQEFRQSLELDQQKLTGRVHPGLWWRKQEKHHESLCQQSILKLSWTTSILLQYYLLDHLRLGPRQVRHTDTTTLRLCIPRFIFFWNSQSSKSKYRYLSRPYIIPSGVGYVCIYLECGLCSSPLDRQYCPILATISK